MAPGKRKQKDRQRPKQLVAPATAAEPPRSSADSQHSSGQARGSSRRTSRSTRTVSKRAPKAQWAEDLDLGGQSEEEQELSEDADAAIHDDDATGQDDASGDDDDDDDSEDDGDNVYFPSSGSEDEDDEEHAEEQEELLEDEKPVPKTSGSIREFQRMRRASGVGSVDDTPSRGGQDTALNHHDAEEHHDEGDGNMLSLEGKSREELLRIADMLDSDSEPEDEEELINNKNTVGNVPMEWYEDYDHIGYNLKGEKIIKKEAMDELDAFLKREENPSAAWRTVYDRKNQREVTLSRRDVELLMRVVDGATKSSEEPFQETIELETRGGGIHPVTNRPEPKRRFIPSKWEAKRISYLASAIRRGWINVEDWHRDKKEYEPGDFPLELYWEDDITSEAARKRAALHIPAPRLKLPGHAESYNPPPEYLLTDEERKQAIKSADYPHRVAPTLPKQYSSMRLVPAYQPFIRERFERCLDLYLCPRTTKLRRNVDPKDLLPDLPKASELRPFPERKALTYRGHSERVRSISVDSTGQWLVSGGDDNTVRVWEVSTGRCLGVYDVGSQVYSVEWNPNPDHSVIAVGLKNGDVLLMVPPRTVIGEQLENALAFLKVTSSQPEQRKPTKGRQSVDALFWEDLTVAKKSPYPKTFQARIHHGKLGISRMSWHSKGDYLAVISEYSTSSSSKDQVRIHRISSSKSQSPFRRLKGQVQEVRFHPSKPVLFVATQRYVRVYDLQKQALMKKLQPGVQFISTMAVHPTGDHVLVGSYDRRVAWFDMDLSQRPYRTLRYHRQAVRAVAFHRTFPLYCSVGDDGRLHLFHARVYDDLLHNPLLVPIRSLPAHEVVEHLGVLDC
eukprot:CAMPEP_0174243616 /NCGR_PEP_ID=MMETSP0417-20130205/32300_1 /TAXON_ID=242541 /ORGANISM="Mayorella sp, Strain BSH-02190019" /LENGTH=846 /DNA_ID=CAMNT_0015323169 /DNA_START=25 /DNA_END=2562 /DNA_ORIENTATION=-